MKSKFALYLLAIILQQQPVFAQSNPLVQYLPPTTSMVISFNPVNLGKKIPGETFRQSSLYEQMTKENSAEMKAFLADPSISGIDFSSDFLFAFITDTSAYKKRSTHLFGGIKNEALFNLTIKKLGKAGDSIRTYGTDKILYKEDGSPAIAWNSHVFVMNLDASKQMNDFAYPYADTISSDSTAQIALEIEIALQKEKRVKVLRNLCFDLMTTKPNNSFNSNNYFTSLLAATGDIKIWNNGTPNQLLGSKALGLPSALFSQMQAFSGNNKTSIINFENGKIVVQSNTYPNDEMAAIYKKYPPVTLNTDLIRRLPKGKIMALFNTSYNPALGMELMQQSGLKEMITEMKSKMPFDFSLLTSAFGNNLMFAVVKAEDPSSEDSITRSLNGIKLLLAMPIADKVKFEELRKGVKNVWDSAKNGGVAKVMKGAEPIAQYNDTLFVLSLSPAVARAFMSNTGTNSATDWLQSKSQYPMLTIFNMKEILKMVAGKKIKEGGEEQKMFDFFDQLIMYGGNYENESLHTTMEFRFSNQNDNSFKQLFDMMNLMAGKK